MVWIRSEFQTSHSLTLRFTYIEEHLKMTKRLLAEEYRDLESALGDLLRGERTFHDAGETVVTILIDNGSTTK